MPSQEELDDFVRRSLDLPDPLEKIVSRIDQSGRMVIVDRIPYPDGGHLVLYEIRYTGPEHDPKRVYTGMIHVPEQLSAEQAKRKRPGGTWGRKGESCDTTSEPRTE